MAYDQYLSRTDLDALWRRGRSHEQRGRNLSSFPHAHDALRDAPSSCVDASAACSVMPVYSPTERSVDRALALPRSPPGETRSLHSSNRSAHLDRIQSRTSGPCGTRCVVAALDADRAITTAYPIEGVVQGPRPQVIGIVAAMLLDLLPPLQHCGGVDRALLIWHLALRSRLVRLRDTTRWC